MHITWTEFYCLRPRELLLLAKSNREYIEAEYQGKLVIARTQAWLNEYAARKKMLPAKADELIKFTWEKQVYQTVDDMKKLFYALAAVHNKKPVAKIESEPPVKHKSKIKK